MPKRFPFKNDWLLNKNIFDEAIKKMESEMNINRKYDIPYVAGYSKDGKTLYIDKDMPKSFKTKNNKVIKTDKYLLWHELIENTLLDKFDTFYQLAHQVALRSEKDAVEADGISWKEYNDFMNKNIKKIADLDSYSHLPSDIDLTPYKDDPDLSILKKMIKSKPSFKDYLNKHS